MRGSVRPLILTLIFLVLAHSFTNYALFPCLTTKFFLESQILLSFCVYDLCQTDVKFKCFDILRHFSNKKKAAPVCSYSCCNKDIRYLISRGGCCTIQPGYLHRLCHNSVPASFERRFLLCWKDQAIEGCFKTSLISPHIGCCLLFENFQKVG